MGDLLERSSPPVRVTRRTLLEVFRAAPDKEAALARPREFAAAAAAGLRKCLAASLAGGIKFERKEGWYEMSQVEEGDALLSASRRGTGSAEVEARGEVRMRARLPGWFTVPTPAGPCDPDWAVVTEGDGGEWRLYLLPDPRREGPPPGGG